MNRPSPGSHKATVNGAALAYHVHGEGPLLVALPGGPGFSHRYLRSPELESRATVVYVDPIGTGESDRLASPRDYGRARDVSDLEALRDHLGFDRLALFGHSAGGFVAQQYAIAHPSRVERLVLADTSPTNGPAFHESLQSELGARAAHRWFPEASAALKRVFTEALTDAEAAEVGRRVLPLYLHDGDRDPRLIDVLAERMDIDMARAQKAPPVPFDFRDDLRKLDIPTLVIVGAADFICAPRLAAMIHDAIRGSRLFTLERSGHMGHLEEPELFARTVGDFLET